MRILCWSISLVTFIGWALARGRHPGNANFPHDFFLFKYAIDILFINFSFVMLLWPFLIEKGIIGADYRTESEFGKAKIFVVLYAILFPGLFLVFISSWATGVAYIPSTMIMLLFIYGYAKNSYLYFFKRRKYIVK